METNRLKRSPDEELCYEIDKLNLRYVAGKTDFLRYQGPAETLLDSMQVIESKAFAVMRRDGGLPDTYAMSGWKHDAEQSLYISGKHWSNEVIVLCREIGFPLLQNFDCDQGVPGRFSACHVEKQLIVYFIYKHTILSHELQSPVEDDSDDELCLGLTDLGLEDEPTHRGENRAYNGRLKELWQKRPPKSLRTAIIYVSRPVCDSCDRLVRHVNRHFDFRIQLHGPKKLAR